MSGTITVNGERRPFVDQTVRELLVSLGLDPAQSGLAVAVNAKIAPRAGWADTRLAPDDRVEIVHARVGG